MNSLEPTSNLEQSTYEPNQQTDQQKLFKMAQDGNWDQVLNEVKKPSLINQRDNGITLLWIATFQSVGTDQNALNARKFIEKILDAYSTTPSFCFDLDAAPLNKPEQTVFWLLCQSICGKYEENRYAIFRALVQSHPTCNINVCCPPEGNFKVSSAGKLFYNFKWTDPNRLYSYYFLRSLIANTSQESLHPSYAMFCFNHLYIIKDKESPDFTQKIYSYLFKMIEENQNWVNEPLVYWGSNKEGPCKTFLELVFESTSTEETEKKLKTYLIFSGAKLSDAAQNGWKTELEKTQKKLKNIFERAKTFAIASPLFPELKMGICWNMIFSEFPELKDFPPSILSKKMWYGFDFPEPELTNLSVMPPLEEEQEPCMIF